MFFTRQRPATDGQYAGIGWESGVDSYGSDGWQTLMVYDCGCVFEHIEVYRLNRHTGLTDIMLMEPEGGSYRPCLNHGLM